MKLSHLFPGDRFILDGYRYEAGAHGRGFRVCWWDGHAALLWGGVEVKFIMRGSK